MGCEGSGRRSGVLVRVLKVLVRVQELLVQPAHQALRERGGRRQGGETPEKWPHSARGHVVARPWREAGRPHPAASPPPGCGHKRGAGAGADTSQARAAGACSSSPRALGLHSASGTPAKARAVRVPRAAVATVSHGSSKLAAASSARWPYAPLALSFCRMACSATRQSFCCTGP